jgi:predicted nucleotidyltransferase
MLDTEQLFGNRTKVRVLRYLATHAGEFMGRQLQGAQVSASPKQEGRWPSSLTPGLSCVDVRAGLTSSPESQALRSQEDHPAGLRGRAQGPSRHGDRHLQVSEGRSLTLILVGSVARGKATLQSDVDILVIAAGGKKEAVERNMEQSRRTVLDRFGRVLSPLVMDEGEFRRRFRQGDPLVREIVETGRVIYGKSIAEVLGNEREEGDTEDRAGRNSKAHGW